MMNKKSDNLCKSINYKHIQAGVLCVTFFPLLSSQASAGPLEPGDGMQVINAANSLGLDAEALACLDVHGSELATMLDRLSDEYATFEQIESLHAQILDHQGILYQAHAVLRDFSDNAQAQSALDEAQTQIVLLSNQVRATRTQLISTVLEELADTSMISEVLEVEGPLAALPPQYRLAVETAGEAKELSWSLRMQERSNAGGSDLNPQAQQILQDIHAQADVQLGKIRVETYGQANQTALDQWVLLN